MDNKDDDGVYAVVEELPMENIISKDNICYGQVLASVCTDTKHTATSTVTRESSKDSKTKFIIVIVVIVLVLSAICVCTIYTLLELSRIKSEIVSSNIVFSQLMDNSSAYLEKSMNASFDVLHQQINDLAGTLNTSIEQIHVRENEKQQIMNDSLDVHHQRINFLFGFHQNSCAAILLLNSSSPSGYYFIRSSNGSPVSVYCNMTLSCGGVTGGWTRVAKLDMTDNSNQCPSTLTQRIDSTKRTCGTSSNSASCAPVIYSIDAIEYSKVCGKIIGYQYSSPDAFYHRASGIDFYYVDGISLTHGGGPRKHIWTFAAALDELGSTHYSTCPCTSINQTSRVSHPPAFVGNDYFCDTGSQGQFRYGTFYGDNPLWDGAGCGPVNICCTFNNPPWFYKELPEPTTDDIEMRVCRDSPSSNEDISIEMIDLYVQ